METAIETCPFCGLKTYQDRCERCGYNRDDANVEIRRIRAIVDLYGSLSPAMREKLVDIQLR